MKNFARLFFLALSCVVLCLPTGCRKKKPRGKTKTIKRNNKRKKTFAGPAGAKVPETEEVGSVREEEKRFKRLGTVESKYSTILTKNGRRLPHGDYTQWYKNGKKHSEGEYENGLLTGSWTYWYQNGNKKEEGVYRKGMRYGTWRYWYKNAQMKAQGDFRGGMKHGHWSEWYDNGKQKSDGSYESNRLVGKWTEWYDNGHKKTEGEYKNNLRTGLFTEWYPDGKIKSRGEYLDGHKNGRWSEWDETGKKIEREYHAAEAGNPAGDRPGP